MQAELSDAFHDLTTSGGGKNSTVQQGCKVRSVPCRCQQQRSSSCSVWSAHICSETAVHPAARTWAKSSQLHAPNISIPRPLSRQDDWPGRRAELAVLRPGESSWSKQATLMLRQQPPARACKHFSTAPGISHSSRARETSKPLTSPDFCPCQTTGGEGNRVKLQPCGPMTEREIGVEG